MKKERKREDYFIRVDHGYIVEREDTGCTTLLITSGASRLLYVLVDFMIVMTTQLNKISGELTFAAFA